MELNDILKLKKGTLVESSLDCGTISSRWFKGQLISEPTKEDNYVMAIIDRGSDGSYWYVYVKEKNKQYFELQQKEWDSEENR